MIKVNVVLTHPSSLPPNVSGEDMSMLCGPSSECASSSEGVWSTAEQEHRRKINVHLLFKKALTLTEKKDILSNRTNKKRTYIPCTFQ